MKTRTNTRTHAKVERANVVIKRICDEYEIRSCRQAHDVKKLFDVINGTCVIILISHRQQTHAYGCHWALRNRCQCQVCVSSLSTGTTGRSEEPKQGSIQDLYSVQCLQFNRSVHAPTGKRCCNRDRLGAAGWATAVTNIQLKSWNNTTVSSRYRPLYILQLREFLLFFFYDEPFPFLMKRLPLTISLKEEAWAAKEVGSHR